MSGRRNQENRCARCQIYRPLCICAEIPHIELRTRLIVLMHHRELRLPTNSAGLACRALPNSEILIRGEPEKRTSPGESEELLSKLANALLLFPSEDAVELTPEFVKTLPEPVTLVIPDGSWRQARRAAKRIGASPGIVRVKLPPGEPSHYRLRKEAQEGNLSTFEAIARAMGVLECRDTQEKLEALFLKMVERRLWSQGKLRASKCTTGIPEGAFEAMRLAGIAGGGKPRSRREPSVENLAHEL